MKLIKNWRNATVADTEADGLLDEATKLHVFSYDMLGKRGSIEGHNHERIKKFFQHHIDNKIPIVMHSGISYDIPLVEKILGIDLSEVMIICSLSLSWYLNIERQRHGLDSFLEDYGIAKPKIDDWEGLTYEEYKFRCETDVEINKALWDDLRDRLIEMYTRVKYAIDSGQADGTRMSPDEQCYIDQYKEVSTVDEYIDRILTFLMFKADCARLKEATRWKVDVPALDIFIDEMSILIEAAKVELEGVMPQVPQYSKKNYPAKPFKKDGSLSASGISWNEEIRKIGQADSSGNALAEWVDETTIKVLKSYEPPNINGHQQIKDFLFSKGWKPTSFKFVKDEEAMQRWADDGFKKHLKPKPRAIPQVSIEGDEGKQLCPSVLKLAENVPEIMSYAKYTTIKHRLDMCKGFKRDLREGGYLCARVGGYTNTLREMHRELVNLPSVNKPYGKEIRGLLIAGRGQVLMGSDMSGLEDRVKHMFMMPHDSDYVNTMTQKGYDPHLAIAVMAGLMTEAEMAKYKELKVREDLSQEEVFEFARLNKIRQAGKSGNYACQYGSGADTLARTANISLDVAKKVVEGYKKLNWAIEAIADEQCVIMDSFGKMWLVNPINGFAYSLRGEKDRFSTLCQGTGSYFFDMWVDLILDKMLLKFGVKRLTATMHDEFTQCFKDTEENKQIMKEITESSIEDINVRYYLRRNLGCDVQFGLTYAGIH